MKKFFLWILIAAVFLTAFAGCQSSKSTLEETQGAENSTPSLGEGPLNVDISTLPLEEAYAYAVKKYEEDPENHRDLCDLQIETSQIIEIDGKYYQSYVASNVDIRYIWISHAEFPDERGSLWDWYTVGTAAEYSMDLLGKVDEGRRD